MGVNHVDSAVPIEPEPQRPGGREQPVVPSPPIGLNRPLLIRVHEIFTGEKDSGELLIASATRSALTNEAAPYAMHGVHKHVRAGTFLPFTAAKNGSPVVFYTKACLDTSLHIQVRLAYDDFDEDRYARYVDLLAKTLQLPVFAASTGLFGPAGAFGSGAAILAAGRIVKVVLNFFDRRIDQDNDFEANYTLHLDTPGLARAKSGWFLMRDDKHESTLMVSPTGDWTGDAEVINTDDSLFVVNAQGQLCYKDGGRRVDDLDQPYVLLHLSGREERELEDFAPAAATAALLERFVGAGGDSVEDLTELVAAVSDMQMARRASELAEQIEEAEPEEQEQLTAQRKAVIKQIRDDEIRKLVKGN